MKTFLTVAGFLVVCGGAGYAPYWYSKQQAATTASYTSADLVEMRSGGGDMCIGTTWDHDSYVIDYRLMNQVEEGARITAIHYVYEDCVESVKEHYEARGFVVEVADRISPSGSQEVRVTAAADYKKDAE